MPNYSEEQYLTKKAEIMEKCYECFAENGLHGTGIRTLASYCGFNHAIFYTYFKDLDDLIIQSTAHCMSKVENDFMEKAPENLSELEEFIRNIPYWTAERHGKKYRLMYQVYTHPKYREYGMEFFQGVNRRYLEYAGQLEQKLGIPADILCPMIFIFIRACVHFALFEDEYYLQMQLRVLKMSIEMYLGRPEQSRVTADSLKAITSSAIAEVCKTDTRCK